MSMTVWIIITISLFYSICKVYKYLIDIIDNMYRNQIAISNTSDKRDCSIIYQGLYSEQLLNYSKLIKPHLISVSFYDLFRLCYPDGLVTRSRIRAVIAYYVYGIPSIVKNIHKSNIHNNEEEQIVPKNDICVPINKTLNQLTKYFERIYLPFDSVIKFNMTMENLLVEKAKVFDRRLDMIINSMSYYNQIRCFTLYDSTSIVLENIKTYIRLYSDLVDKGFEIVDLRDCSVRLFIYIPHDDYSLLSLGTDSILMMRRSAIKSEISDLNVRNFDRRIKVYYPLDNQELEDIITYINSDKYQFKKNPIIITQIRSIFSTYDYDGRDLENLDISNFLQWSSTAIKYFIDTLIWTDTSLNNSDHPYHQVIHDSMKVFDFIKDSGLATFGTIDVQLEKSMTILAPMLITSYDRLDLYPILKLKLIDPICYPYSFYQIYKTIKNDSDKNIIRIKRNSIMMNLLNELNLIDIYVDNNGESYHPIFSDRVRIFLTSTADKYVNVEQLRSVLSMRYKTHILASP